MGHALAPWPKWHMPATAPHLLGHHEQVSCGPQAGEQAVVAHLSAASSLQEEGRGAVWIRVNFSYLVPKK